MLIDEDHQDGDDNHQDDDGGGGGNSGSYLIFVIFFTQAKYLENKIYTEKRVNYDKIHSKLPIFCVITAKYTVNCQFFALNLKTRPNWAR